MLLSTENISSSSLTASKRNLNSARTEGLEFNAFDTTPAQKLSSQSGKTILFNISKRESFHPSSGFKSLQKRVRNIAKVGVFKEDITFAKLSEASLVIFGAPKSLFSSSDFTALKAYLERGGSILFLSSEGGDTANTTNINYFLEDYGMSVNSDGVARTEYFKYAHPKEALISTGILNREINKAAGKRGSVSSALPPDAGSFDPTYVCC
jgi:intraflagellar transport protein 52